MFKLNTGMHDLRKLIAIIEQNSDDNALVPTTISTKSKRWSDSDLDRMAITAQNADDPKRSAGAYYQGRKVTADPHIYTKREHQPAEYHEDAQAEFLKTLVKLNGSNPYLPVVYDITQTQDPKRAMVKHQFTVQKLIPLKKVSTEVIISLIDLLLNKTKDSVTKIILTEMYDIILKEYNYLVSVKRKQATRKRRKNSRDDLGLLLAQIMRGYIKNKLHSDDPQLTQAVKLIQNLKDNNQYRLDLHPGNVMLRPSASGYWPVFNDPLSNFIISDPISSNSSI